MGNVTISLEEKDDKKLRALAQQLHKGNKGSMSKVVSECLDLMTKKGRRELAMLRQIEWMGTGFELGKILAKSREEIYDRQ